MPKPAVSGCPSTRGRIFLSVVSYVVKRKKGLASWRSPFCFSGTNAPVDVVTLFQSTPPRGGRLRRVLAPTSIWHFNPRPPRGGRHGLARKAPAMLVFQTTPPYEGGDCGCTSGTSPSPDFNPRPPRGGRQQKQPNDSTVFTKKQTIITNGVLKIRLITNMLCVLLKISFRIRCEAAALFCLLELRI